MNAAARPRSPEPARDRRSSGFSLVELLVSMAISGFVILAVVGIYSNSRDTYTHQDELSRLYENIRIGTSLVERTLRQGNYKRIPMMRDQNVELVRAFSFAPIDGTDGGSTAVGDSDTLQVVFNGNTRFPVPAPPISPADGAIVDCAGDPVAAEDTSINRFKVVVQADGRPWLGCWRPNHPTTPGFVPLIPDVEAMEVLYGVYSDESRTATNYVPWSATVDPMRVVALRLHLLFRSGAEMSPSASTATYLLGERTYGPFSDRFMRTAVETTVVVRSSAM